MLHQKPHYKWFIFIPLIILVAAVLLDTYNSANETTLSKKEHIALYNSRDNAFPLYMEAYDLCIEPTPEIKEDITIWILKKP